MICSAGYCSCLRGAVCSGEYVVPDLDLFCYNCTRLFKEPTALASWWKDDLGRDAPNRAAACEPERLNRDYCPFLAPCEPPEACLGNNKCTTGYEYLRLKCESMWSGLPRNCHTDSDCMQGGLCSVNTPQACATCVLNYTLSWLSHPVGAVSGSCVCQPASRCSMCTINEYYRESGECVPCPKNVILIIIVFLLAAAAVCVGGYILNKKSVNMAFLSIGVDYFQVLAMFARAKVAWPAFLRTVFQWFSAFNLNIELCAPECTMPNISFSGKFLFIQLLPLAACAIFLLLHLVKYVDKRFIKGRRKKLHSHVAALIATGLVLFYYLYLLLTRTSLDIFNCNPTVPCWQQGGLHLQLLPWAALAFVAYTLGYPALLFFLLFKNRNSIKEDQILRAKGVGQNRLSNPTAYELRKKLHKMYYHFKPDYCLWILVVIARKFLVAFTSLMFRDNASFQLAVALLVIFCCYVLQVRFSPYMSPSEFPAVVKD